nr:hypothetical protein [Tanacetum cinerariifolium]
LALGRAHTNEPTLSQIRAPIDSETAIVVNGSKAREREVSDAKGNSSTKASVVITRPSCLIDSPSIIQSRKQSQWPLKKDDFYFKILSWIVKKPKGKKEEQKQRRCLPHRPLTIYPRSLSLRQRDSLFLEQARCYQDKILAEEKKEEEKEERTATITSLHTIRLKALKTEKGRSSYLCNYGLYWPGRALSFLCQILSYETRLTSYQPAKGCEAGPEVAGVFVLAPEREREIGDAPSLLLLKSDDTLWRCYLPNKRPA